MEVSQGNENKMMKNIFKGVGIALIATVILLFIFSCLLTYTDINEAVIAPVIIVMTGISILMGSSIGTMKIKKNGLLNGALIGGIYMLILYLISSLLNWTFGLTMQSIIMIAVSMIFGVLGGVIGVNRK